MSSDRRRLVIELYGKGATLQEIWDALNVTRERARQLLHDYGVERRPRIDRLYGAHFPERAAEVEALFLQLRDDTAVADQTGIPRDLVGMFIDRTVPDPDVLRRRRKARSEFYSDEELVSCLQAGAKELGSPMSHSAYSEWTEGRALDDGRPWPGPQGIALPFGSWRKALARAGLPANPTAGPDPRFELSDAVDAMVAAWTETGTPPTVEKYDAWRNGRREFPSSPTSRKFAEGWDELQLAAWPIVHGRPLPGVGSQQQTEGDIAGSAEPAAVGGPYRRANDSSEIEPSNPFERDPQELERSLNSHNQLQNDVSDRARSAGYEPLSPLALDPEFDLAWRMPDGALVVVEVKSATASNLEGQLRLGLGQLLRYGAILTAKGEEVLHVLAVERHPPDDHWVALFDGLGVILVTPATLDEFFDHLASMGEA